MTTKSSVLALSSKLDVVKELFSTPGYHQDVPRYGQISYTDLRDGVSNPKWRTTIKNGGDATTPMTGTRSRRLKNERIIFACGYDPVPLQDPDYYIENVTGTLEISNEVPDHISGTSLDSADNRALSRAFAAVKQQQSHSQGIQFLGELGETLKQLKHPFAGIRKLVDQHFKNVQKRSVGRSKGPLLRPKQQTVVKAAGESWLEVAFGIKPLLSDVKAIAETIARAQYDSRRSVVVGYGEDSKSLDTSIIDFCGNYTRVNTSRIDRTTISVRYKVGLDFSKSADFGSAERLQELSGFTPEDFIPSIYELIPWSFLLDYFSNVGDLVAAGCASQSTVSYAMRTERLQTLRVQTHTPSISASLPSRFWSRPPGVGASTLARTNVSRSSAPKLQLPSLEWSLPGSPLKWGNMAALWASSEKKLLRF